MVCIGLGTTDISSDTRVAHVFYGISLMTFLPDLHIREPFDAEDRGSYSGLDPTGIEEVTGSIYPTGDTAG